MISDALITAAALLLEPPTTGHLSAAAQAQLLTYIRAVERYKKTPWQFTDLVDKLAAAVGFDAQFLQAVLSAAKESGATASQLSQFSSIKVDKISLGINSSASANSYSYFDDALNLLYEVLPQRSSVSVTQMDSSICIIHHRSRSICGCDAVLVF